MLASTTSPSDFIYRRPQDTPATSPTPEDIAMRPEAPTKVTGTKSLPVTAAEWEAANAKSLPLSPGECSCPPPRMIKAEPGTHSPTSLTQHPPWLSPPSGHSPDSTLPHSSASISTPTDNLNRASSLAASSSRTVSIPSNSNSSSSSSTRRFVNICAAIRAVHDICLQSTRTYIDTHIANRRARAASQGWSTVCRDSGSGSGSGSRSSRTGSHSNSTTHTAIPPSTPSLLLNTSSICSMLWSGSQRDRLHVLNVERLAIETMGRLMRWAETVTLGEWDEWQGAEEQTLWQVLEAGRHLCDWLGVPDAIQAMEVLECEVLGEYGIS
ncbi:uncharacterized protein F4812DRAFT_459467 [Daldinia caldariorum]|uniref:uncharacterized protein n=1 Tax=Daldinia caldariorum TaxID=326644 RepID=UPI00200788F4|nr:uncharacterized protein F4812DRAFT_459467 [Daldinia caldariorum]KAI1467362.1 hypothetical protein F4812DRAFT_459467 [Daldinia caldariorum]